MRTGHTHMTGAIGVLLAAGFFAGGSQMSPAAESPSDHQRSHGATGHGGSASRTQGCEPFRTPGASAGIEGAKSFPSATALEGVQIETTDVKPYELLFEQVLRADPVMRLDHPQVDRLRGYCYRDVLIVVRQDIKTPRPTGWVQINFVVADVSAVKQELEEAVSRTPLARQDEAEQSKVVRIRLKPDVPRSHCRAIRLEVGGPEGFMVGFDQFKAGSCKGEGTEGR